MDRCSGETSELVSWDVIRNDSFVKSGTAEDGGLPPWRTLVLSRGGSIPREVS